MPNDIQVLPQSKTQQQEFSWGNLTWFANRALGNSDDMTVGRCILKPGLFLLGYAPEVIQFTSRLLDDKGPAYGTLEDALELLQIYEAYLRHDGIIHPIESSS